MRRLPRIIFVGLPGVFLLAFAWFLLIPHEPSYQGKTLTTWLEEAKSKDLINFPEADPAAVNAIRQMGTKAIPTLLRYAATPKDSRLKKSLLQLQDMHPRLHLHLHSQDSMTTFLGQIKDTSTESNWYGVFTIAYVCGTNLSPAVPVLISALNSTNHFIVNQALTALGLVHQRPEQCVPAILPFLEGTKDRGLLRSCSIDTLRQFGKAAKPAVPALIRCLADPDQSIRVNATNALREIDPEAAARAGVK